MTPEVAENLALKCQHKGFWNGQAHNQHVQKYLDKVESLQKDGLQCRQCRHHNTGVY